jgi:hypothetical protein
MILRSDEMFSINLTVKDFQNIILWHEKAFRNSDEISINDQETKVKVQAIMIHFKETIQQNSDMCTGNRDL